MDWAEINPDLLCLIARKVGDVVNFIRLRAVCKHWRSSVHPSDLPPQLPCILLFSKYKINDKPPFDVNFVSLNSGKIHSIPNSENNPVLTTSSKSGYLWSSPKTLFNPLTGKQVPHSCGSCCYVCAYFTKLKEANNHDIEMMFSTCDGQIPQTTIFWRYSFSQQEWTKIFQVPLYKGMLTYCDDKLYIVDMDNGETKILDVNTQDIVSVIVHPSVKFYYLIEACGDILGVWMDHKSVGVEFQLKIYRLEIAMENPCWVELNGGIGDKMLFLDDYRAVGFCLKASDIDGSRGNCIYMTRFCAKKNGNFKCVIVRYDLNECKAEELLSDHEEISLFGTWFVPSLY